MFRLSIQYFGSIIGMPGWQSHAPPGLIVLSNIDRLAAIFQTLHPSMWMDPILAKAPLDPFHQDDENTSWTSNACQDWKASLNYDYDDLAVPDAPSDAARSAADSTSETAAESTDLRALKRKINQKYGGLQHAVGDSEDISGAKKNDYVINIKYDR